MDPDSASVTVEYLEDDLIPKFIEENPLRPNVQEKVLRDLLTRHGDLYADEIKTSALLKRAQRQVLGYPIVVSLQDIGDIYESYIIDSSTDPDEFALNLQRVLRKKRFTPVAGEHEAYQERISISYEDAQILAKYFIHFSRDSYLTIASNII